jgi:acetate kinase
MSDPIVVLNAGSSSIRFSLFVERERELALDLRSQIEGLYTAPKFQGKGADGAPWSETSSGENSAPVRERVLHAADWLGVRVKNEQNRKHGPRLSAAQSRVSVWEIPNNEELMITPIRAPASRQRQVQATAPGTGE